MRLLFEVTSEIANLPKRNGVTGSLARRKEETNYLKYLAFNGLIELEKGMRAEVDKRTALTVLYRKNDMLLGLVGGKCRVCGTAQFPRSAHLRQPELQGGGQPGPITAFPKCRARCCRGRRTSSPIRWTRPTITA